MLIAHKVMPFVACKSKQIFSNYFNSIRPQNGCCFCLIRKDIHQFRIEPDILLSDFLLGKNADRFEL